MKKLALIFFSALFLTACAATPPARQPRHRVTNVALDPVTARNIRNIAVFPLADPEENEGASERLSEIIGLQVLKIGRFKIMEPTTVKTLLIQKQFLFPGSGFGVEDMIKIGKDLGADAIIYGQLIAYRPYQYFPENLINKEAPAVIGLHLKMLSVKDRHVVWAASDTFYGGDAAVAALALPEDRWKVKVDIDFLSTLLVQELTKTLNY